MKYYEMHEQCYLKNESLGQRDWNRNTKLSELLNSDASEALLSILEENHYELKNKSVLDIGTGGGNIALACAQQGASSLGIDISKTAIKLARENAQLLGLEASFEQKDILRTKMNQKFDLVSDSATLHCIVGAEDRDKFYQLVRAALKKDGYFFIFTMIFLTGALKLFTSF